MSPARKAAGRDVRATQARVACWGLLAVVLAGALFVGAREDGSPPTDAERARRITEKIRCPTCRSQSVADSDAPAARAISEETLRRVREGQTEDQIVDYLVTRYKEEILLEPPRQGVGVLVWGLPVVGVAVTVAALFVVFRRWRPAGRQVSAADRALVDEALKS